MYEEDKIISVCVVLGEENFITRIADVQGNELILPMIDRSREFKGFNKDRLFYKPQAEIALRRGDVGVWEWNVSPNLMDPSKDWVNSEYKKDLNPIEVVEKFWDKNKEELCTLLREGMTLPWCNHRRIFIFKNGPRKLGILCDSSQLEQVEDGIRIKDEVYGVPCYDIREGDLLRTERTLGFPERCLYRFLQLPQDNGYFTVRSPEKAVKNLLMRRLNRRFVLEHGGTREDFKTFRRVMDALPEKDIIEDIVEHCHCPEHVAAGCWKIFSDNVEQFVRCEDIDTKILCGLLDKDEVLRTRLREEWRLVSQKELALEEVELHQLRATLETQRKQLKKERETLETNFAESQKFHQAELTRIQNETQVAEACLEKARTEAGHYETLSREGLRLVREKLNLAREEAAEFLADLALFGSSREATVSLSSVMPGCPTTIARFIPGAEPATWEDVEDVTVLMEELRENLKRAGADPKRIPELSAFLYGALLSNTSLLLAGPQGTSVADALSCAIAGRHAAVLDCCGEWDPTVLADIRQGADAVVVVRHPFQKRWIDHLLPELDATGKMWIFVHPYADDLSLEPSGLYHYVLPVVLDLFMLHPAAGDMICCRKGENYSDFPVTEEFRNMMGPLKKLSRNRYLEVKVSQLMARACGVKEKGEEALLLWSCVIFPLAVALGRKDTFLEIIQDDSGLSQKDRTFLEDGLGDIQ